MTYLGKSSLAAILKIALDFIWYAQLILFTVVIIGVLIGVSFQGHLSYRWPVTFSESPYKEIKTTDTTASDVKVIGTKGELLFTRMNNRENIAITHIGLALIFGTFLLVTFQLKMILSNFTRKEPFTLSNSKRIRLIGVILIASSLINFLFGIFYTNYINTNFQWNESITFTQSLDISTILMGLLIMILAEIFRVGTELQEEKNLTI